MKKNLTYKELPSVTNISLDRLVTHTDKKIILEEGDKM
jgi:transposase, IS4 family